MQFWKIVFQNDISKCTQTLKLIMSCKRLGYDSSIYMFQYKKPKTMVMFVSFSIIRFKVCTANLFRYFNKCICKFPSSIMIPNPSSFQTNDVVLSDHQFLAIYTNSAESYSKRKESPLNQNPRKNCIRIKINHVIGGSCLTNNTVSRKTHSIPFTHWPHSVRVWLWLIYGIFSQHSICNKPVSITLSVFPRRVTSGLISHSGVFYMCVSGEFFSVWND